MFPWPTIYLCLLPGLACAISDNDIEIRGSTDDPEVVITDSGTAVTFSGLRCNTSMYGDDFGLDNDGRTVEEFLGIPYAENPDGTNRFREVPLKKVSSLPANFDASVWKPGCMQEPGMFSNDTSDFSENCLYLNIWRRRHTRAGDNKPVVFIIHGGGYTAGDGHEFDWRGAQLAHFGDVVVVNANYRLGIFGFLDLGLPEAGGHQGHMDQVKALQWVARYIVHFGGDPSRVTLFGVSAGSFSISWHLMAGLSQGLFHAAIMDAGVLTHTHAETRADHIDRAARIAETHNGCLLRISRRQSKQGMSSAVGTRDILNCLASMPATRLIELQQRFAPSQTYTFRPTYSNEAFLPTTPECITNAKRFGVRVPIIIGDTTNEGLFLLTYRTHDPKPCLESFQEALDWSLRILAGHHAERALTPGERNRIVKSVYDHPSDDLPQQRQDNQEFPLENTTCPLYRQAGAQIIGDGLFVCPVMNFAAHYSEVESSTYFFRWNRVRTTEVYPNEASDGAYHGLMFYTAVGSQYLYLSSDGMSHDDKTYIWNSINMVAAFSADPHAEPTFGSSKLARYNGGLVNNFDSEGLRALRDHPELPRCRATWPIFPRIQC